MRPGQPSHIPMHLMSWVLHRMINYIFTPWEGHRDEVSYYGTFFIDSIVTDTRFHHDQLQF